MKIRETSQEVPALNHRKTQREGTEVIKESIPDDFVKLKPPELSDWKSHRRMQTAHNKNHARDISQLREGREDPETAAENGTGTRMDLEPVVATGSWKTRQQPL